MPPKSPRKAKPGKYARVLVNLPRLVNTEITEYQQKVIAVKDEILREKGVTWLPATYLASEYVAVRLEIEEIKKELYDANLRLEAYEQMAAAQYEVEGCDSLRLESGHTVSVRSEPYCRVDDKEKFRLWCIANGLEQSLQLWPSSMESITKERLLAGEPEPDGVSAHVVKKVILRQS